MDLDNYHKNEFRSALRFESQADPIINVLKHLKFWLDLDLTGGVSIIKYPGIMKMIPMFY